MKGFNIQQMMKQAQQMQKKMAEAQEELQSVEVAGNAGNGLVSVKLNAKNEILSVKIKPEAINPENPDSVDEEDIEILEDLILNAFKDANARAAAAVEEKMGAVTGGMPINIPGLF